MKIKCRNCGHKKKVNVDLIVKIIGGTLPLGGFAAWTTYLLAGTGLALPIVTALIAGGPAILIFKKPIIKWILKKGYKCSQCGASDWKAT